MRIYTQTHTPVIRITAKRIPALDWAAAIVTLLAVTACSPPQSPGSTSLGETGTETMGDSMDAGSETSGELNEDLSHGEVFCVDIVSGQTSCWVGWESAYAKVMLDCQVDDLVTAGVWLPGVDAMLEGWGQLVVCHETLAGGSVCLLGSNNVALSLGPDGWAPTIKAVVGDYDPVDPPCGEPELFEVGGMWGPCPTDPTTGVHTLCYAEATACIPAEDVASTVCAPLSMCPGVGPSAALEMGDLDVCYARCLVDGDCIEGMVCDRAWSDGSRMCAWPF